jgi:type IV fimbrial biogenesis protein FimT
LTISGIEFAHKALQEIQLMKKNAGFTFLELMVVIAIMAVGAAIAIPNMIQWRTEANLRGSANNLRADLNMAKMLAVRENALVVVNFFGDRYEVFVDNGAGLNTGNWTWDADERRFRNRNLRPGVSIDLANTTFAGNRTRFNERGLPDQLGTVVLVSSGGQQNQIGINRMGRVDLQ